MTDPLPGVRVPRWARSACGAPAPDPDELGDVLAAVHRLPPWRSIAVAFAILLVSVLLKIGDDANYEFIYFQF